jgi:hypothetical protein
MFLCYFNTKQYLAAPQRDAACALIPIYILPSYALREFSYDILRIPVDATQASSSCLAHLLTPTDVKAE